MSKARIIIYGNAGSGKSTMARLLAEQHGLKRVSLDDFAWDEGPVRRPLESSLQDIHAALGTSENWVVEGCYGDIVTEMLPSCTELRFLNPGVEACIDNCRKRPWEPNKYATPDEQANALEMLIDWVREYLSRDDECGLAYHRAMFDEFAGNKREWTSLSRNVNSE